MIIIIQTNRPRAQHEDIAMDRPFNPAAHPQQSWWSRTLAALTRFAEAAEYDPTEHLAARIARVEARLAALEAQQRGN